jgi:Amt family ammonium transporter
MQLGFALLEAGSVRAMNTKNILMQNLLDTCVSIAMFWWIGYGISKGGTNMAWVKNIQQI